MLWERKKGRKRGIPRPTPLFFPTTPLHQNIKKREKIPCKKKLLCKKWPLPNPPKTPLFTKTPNFKKTLRKKLKIKISTPETFVFLTKLKREKVTPKPATISIQLTFDSRAPHTCWKVFLKVLLSQCLCRIEPTISQ